MANMEPPPINDQDFTCLLQQAKARYVIKDKDSNKILGYAIMFTDRSVTAEDIKLDLFKWPEEVAVADVPPPIPRIAHEDDALLPGSLVADLDLSADSSDSMNMTVEEDLSPLSCNVNEVTSGQIRTDVCPENPQTVDSSISPSQPVHQDSSLSPAPIQSSPHPSTLSSPVYSHKSPTAMLASGSIYSFQADQNVEQEAPSEKSLASDMVDSAKDQAKSRQTTGGSNKDSVSCEKRKFEDGSDECKSKIVSMDQQIERPSRESLAAFYEYVEEGRERKNHRVKCLLCNDGRLLSLGNFSRHIKAIHEPPVACENCGQVFSREQLRTHLKRRKCAWQKLEFVEKPPSFSFGGSYGQEETSPFPTSNERYQDEILDISDSSEAGNIREISHSLQVEKGLSGGISEQSPVTSTNHAGQSSQSEGGDWVFITLAHVSVEKYRSNFKIEKQSKVKKLMKAFGKEHKIVYNKKLKFFIGSEELKGDEKIGELNLNRGRIDDLRRNGGEIEVFGEIVAL